MCGPEEWPSRSIRVADRIRLTGPAATTKALPLATSAGVPSCAGTCLAGAASDRTGFSQKISAASESGVLDSEAALLAFAYLLALSKNHLEKMEHREKSL
jgi:hypothetical protein